jgi:hypothetical protein
MGKKLIPEIYFSYDIEADGMPVGLYSMLSIGMCVAGIWDGTTYVTINPDTYTFYTELKPISDRFDPDALAVSGLDRLHLMKSGEPPVPAMTRLAYWVNKVALGMGCSPVAAAWPAGFDWPWLSYYMEAYSEIDNPFSFKSQICIMDRAAQLLNKPIASIGKRSLPVQSGRPHTHHALDDALQQADILSGLMRLKVEKEGGRQLTYGERQEERNVHVNLESS